MECTQKERKLLCWCKTGFQGGFLIDFPRKASSSEAPGSMIYDYFQTTAERVKTNPLEVVS